MTKNANGFMKRDNMQNNNNDEVRIRTEVEKAIAAANERINELRKMGYKPHKQAATKKNRTRIAELGLEQFMPNDLNNIQSEYVLYAATGEGQYLASFGYGSRSRAAEEHGFTNLREILGGRTMFVDTDSEYNHQS